MEEACETYMYRGNVKLVIDNFIMTKNKISGSFYYWRCEKRSSKHCRACARTVLIDGQHYLRHNMTPHNHTTDASRKHIIAIYENLKRNARETNDTPRQIIQMVLNGFPSSVISSLPKYQALSNIISRERKKHIIVITLIDRGIIYSQTISV